MKHQKKNVTVHNRKRVVTPESKIPEFLLFLVLRYVTNILLSMILYDTPFEFCKIF
jgi:hypothetical protein